MSNQSFFTDKTYARGDEAYISATLALTAAEQAAADAADALTAVQAFDPDGITSTFFQTEAPTSGMSNGDMWIDSNNGNHLYRYVDKYGTTTHTNLCPNPNGQYGVQTWTATNGSIASDSTLKLDGMSSLRSVVSSVASLPYMSINVVASAASTYTVSAYLTSSLASAITKYQGLVTFRNGSNGVISTASIPVATATAADQWVRLSATITAPAGTTNALLDFGPSDATEVQVSDAYFLNGVMWETGSTLNPAIAGDLDGCSWSGTPGASSSVYIPGWIDVQDQSIATALLNAAGAQATADGKIRTFAQTTAPAMTNGTNVGDLWMDTDDNNKMYRWSGTAWVPLADPRVDTNTTNIASIQTNLTGIQGQVDGKAVIWVQSTAPSLVLADKGDIWIDTSTTNRVTKVWDGSAFQDITDTATLQALSTVATKITTYYSATQPVGTADGDLWVDTANGNLLKRFNAPWGLATRQNLVANPSAEVNISSWNKSAGMSQISRVTTEFFHGSASISAGGAGTTVGSYINTPSTAATGAPATPGTTYRGSVYVKGTGTAALRMTFRNSSSADTGTILSPTVTLTSSWQRIDVSMVAPAGTAIVFIWIFQQTADGLMYVDAAMIEPSTTLNPYFDGSYTQSTWAGTANNSYSTYTPAWTDMTDTRLPNSVKSMTTEYSVNSSETVAPTTGWSTATPTRTPGTFVWYRVTVVRTDNSSSTTNPALLTGNTGATGPAGTPAALISLTANAQVLAVPAGGGATTPATATVTGTATNTTIANWTYSVDGGAFSATVPAGVSRTTNTVTVTGSTMTARTIAIKADDGTVGDTLTVAKVSDGATGATGSAGAAGAAGADAYTVLLSNEAQVFPGSTNAALAGSASSSVIAYKAAVQQAATIGTITGQVTGLTTTINNNGTTTAGFTVTVTTALVTQSGTLTVPITVGGVAFTKTFAWSVSYTGATGATGSPGANATTVAVTATTQVLVSPAAGGATTPATSTVTGTPTGTTISTWDYSVDSGAFSTTAPAGVSRTTNTVTVTGSTMTAKTIGIRATTASGVADTLTVAKVTDGATGATGGTGAAGADAYTVILTNEAQVFPGSTSAALAGTATSTVIAYKGTVQQSATIGTITGQVTGLTTAITNNSTTAPVVTVTVTTALTTQSGVLTIPVTVGGVAFTKYFSWSVSYTGATGATGSTGATGPTGVSVSSVTPYFQTVTTGSAAPATPTASPPPAPWTTTEPTYTAGTELYRTERILFSDSSFAYTTVTKVSSYAAAVAAQATANSKNQVFYGTTVPGTAANTAGDIWFQYTVAGQLIGFWIGQGGTSWQSQQLTNSTIATLDAAKITSGYLDVANRVKAGSIVAGQLSVGVMNTNLVADPSFENVPVGTASPVNLPSYVAGTPSNNWRQGINGAGTVSVQAVTGRSRSGNWACTLTVNSTPSITTAYLYSPTIPIVPGTSYKVSFYATRTTTEATLLLDGYYGSTDTTVTTPFTMTSDQDVFAQPTIQTVEPYDPALFDVYTYDFTAPPGANFITFRIQCYTQTATVSTTMTIDDFSLLEKRPGGGSELTPAGLRLFDAEGLEVGAFVSNRPNYFTVFQNGAAVATINPNGAATFADLDVVDKDISLAGVPLLGRQADRFLNREFNESQGWDVGRDYTVEPIGVTEAVSNGVVGHHPDTAVPATAITPAGGYVLLNQINVDMEMGRFYTFKTSPYLVLMSSGCTGGLFLYYTSDGTDPTIASSILARCYHTGGGNYETFQISDRPVAGSSNQRDFRVLAVFRFLSGTGSLTPVGDPFYLSCYDMGYGYPMGTGKLINTTVQNGGTATPAASTKTYVTSWVANNSQTRRGTSSFGNNTVNPTSITGSTTMLAGYYSGSNGNQYDFLEFTAANSTGGEVGKTISQALTGATLSKVEIYVKNINFPMNAGGSGSMRFAATTLTTLPAASAFAPPAVTYTANQGFTNGQGRWIQLPSAATTAIKTSGGRVLIVGPGSSTSQYYYSKWNNHAASSGKPQIRLTYTK